MSQDILQAGLLEIIAAYGPKRGDWHAGQATAIKVAARKELKQHFAPIARELKYVTAEHLIQLCLEQPGDHALHGAAAALVKAGSIPWTPWVSIGTGPAPKRWIASLTIGVQRPEVYAIEYGPRVSVWSLENGAHLVDLKLPGKKGVNPVTVVELPDGRLRCLTNQGLVCERAPGAGEFSKIHDLDVAASRDGSLGISYGHDPELRHFVTQIDREPVEIDGRPWQRLRIHEAVKSATREIKIPFSHTKSCMYDSRYVYEDGFIVLGAQAVGSTASGKGDPKPTHALVLVDVAAATTRALPMKDEVREVVSGGKPGRVGVTLRNEDGVESFHFVDLASGKITDGVPPPDDDDAGLPADYWHYRLPGDPFKKVTGADAKRGLVVSAGGDPAVELRVIRPYDPARVLLAPAQAATRPLAWARPGAVLRYKIADHDVEDEWTFEVLEAGAELVLRVSMAGKVVAPSLRFTEDALTSASSPVAFAQGGADIDVDAPQSKTLPPIVVSRAAHGKLVAGKALAWKSEWTPRAAKLTANRIDAVVRVNAAEQPIAALAASGEDQDVTLTVLDDPRWPLVIERVEGGDNFVRLVAIDLSRATDAPASVAAKPRAAPLADKPTVAAKPGAKAARRFEFVEGTSSKFWEIAREDSSLTIRYGRIGTAGQSQEKRFASADEAERELDKLIREKTKKGYRE